MYVSKGQKEGVKYSYKIIQRFHILLFYVLTNLMQR